MSTKLTNAIETMRCLIGGDVVLREKFDEVAQQVIEKHKKNVEMHIPIGRFIIKTANIGEMNCGEDYQIDTYTKVDEDGIEWTSKEAYAEHVRDYAESKYKAYKIYKEDDIFIIENDEGEALFDAYETEEKAHQEIPLLKEAYIVEKIAEYDELEEVYDKIYWDTVFQYNGEVNEELAKKLRLGVLTFLTGEHEKEKFLFLNGCGLDFSQLFTAYRALEWGYVQESEAYKFSNPSDREYFKQVVGEELYIDTLKALRIFEMIQKNA